MTIVLSVLFSFFFFLFLPFLLSFSTERKVLSNFFLFLLSRENQSLLSLIYRASGVIGAVSFLADVHGYVRYRYYSSREEDWLEINRARAGSLVIQFREHSMNINLCVEHLRVPLIACDACQGDVVFFNERIISRERIILDEMFSKEYARTDFDPCQEQTFV